MVQEQEESDSPAAHDVSIDVPPSSSSSSSSSLPSQPTHQELRINHWKASPWAVGCVDPTWKDTRESCSRRRRQRGNSGDSRSSRQKEFESYLCFGAWICAAIRARRVGNMAVLMGNNVGGQDNGGDSRISCVVGPYWPVNICLVFPFVIALSIAVAVRGLSDEHPGIIAAWAVLTISLLVSMVCVSCRDPGILRRYAERPEENSEEEWIWNDQALTFRPRTAKYDSECAVFIKGFDHTCPWTGTAIGEGNMCAFRVFVVLVFGTIVFDIILLVGTVLGLFE